MGSGERKARGGWQGHAPQRNYSQVLKLAGELNIKHIRDSAEDLRPCKDNFEHDLQALLALPRHALLEQEPNYQKDGDDYREVNGNLAQSFVALVTTVADALPVPPRPVVADQAVGPPVILGANLTL